MTDDGPAVIAEGLTKKFGSFIAVDRLDLSIMKGEVVGFIGPNGAGKSTTIRLLCGLLKPSAGRAFVAGFDVGREPEAVRAHIGYMSQKFSLYADLTVRENLRFFAGLYRVRAATSTPACGRPSPWRDWKGARMPWCRPRRRMEAAARPRLRHPASSAGVVSRRAYIRGRARGPPAFLGPDPPLASDGVTILVSTHYMDEAEYCAGSP